MYTGINFGKNTSVGMHHMFELYVNFGPIWMLVGMLIIGLLVACMELIYYHKGRTNLFYEFCPLLCAWHVCVYCDQVGLLAMTVLPAIVLSLAVFFGLSFLIRSPYVPNMLWRGGQRLSASGRVPLPTQATPLPSR
jgi:hypothetical protein